MYMDFIRIKIHSIHGFHNMDFLEKEEFANTEQ